MVNHRCKYCTMEYTCYDCKDGEQNEAGFCCEEHSDAFFAEGLDQ